MFKVLDYLNKLEVVKETSTHITCLCPVCGDDNFKIKKTNPHKNAYRCWSNFCSPQDIQKKLGFKSLFPSKPKKQIPRIKPAKVNFTGTSIARLENYLPIPIKTKKFSGGYTVEERIYPYSKTQRVLRMDNIDTKTKYVYIQYKNEDFVWVSGSGLDFWPVYSRNIETTLIDPLFDTVLFVEGEKTAEFCKERGLAAITLMAGNFHDGLNKSLMLFGLKYPNIRNVIYVPDADTPGLLKADKVQESCWRYGLGCRIIKMSEIVPEPSEGMDLADLEETLFLNFKNVIISNPTESFIGGDSNCFTSVSKRLA